MFLLWLLNFIYICFVSDYYFVTYPWMAIAPRWNNSKCCCGASFKLWKLVASYIAELSNERPFFLGWPSKTISIDIQKYIWISFVINFHTLQIVSKDHHVYTLESVMTWTSSLISFINLETLSKIIIYF